MKPIAGYFSSSQVQHLIKAVQRDVCRKQLVQTMVLLTDEGMIVSVRCVISFRAPYRELESLTGVPPTCCCVLVATSTA